MNVKIKLTTLSIFILIVGSFIFLSPLRYKVISLVRNFSHNQTASVGDIFTDSFVADTSLEEAGSIDESSNPNWWVNSGAYLYSQNGVLGTVQGSLVAEDSWYSTYRESNPSDTNNGANPQNIFRLINKNSWQNFRQEVYFKITATNLSDSPNRNESNGLLLFNRYIDSNNLYYAGVRVDGTMIIKKKIAGVYYTMGSQAIFDGVYDISDNPNLITPDTWIGLRTEVVTLPSGNVLLTLYTDIGMTGIWTLGLQVQDDGVTYGGDSIVNAGYSGIRTDFMDVLFSNYSIEEFDPLVLTPESELPEEGTITFHYDSSLSDLSDVESITSGIIFNIEGREGSYINDETVTLSPGEYVISVSFENRVFSFGESCSSGNISLEDDESITCNVTEVVEEEEPVVSSGGGGGGENVEVDSSLEEALEDEEGNSVSADLNFIPEENKNEEKIEEDPIKEEIKKEKDISQDSIFQDTEEIEKKLESLDKTELVTKTGKSFFAFEPNDVIKVIDEPVKTPKLYYGLRDSSQVIILQAFLALDKEIYPEGLVTGFFGPLTENAVQKFQLKYGIINVLDPFKIGYGKVGPNTINKINEVYSTNINKENILFNYVKE